MRVTPRRQHLGVQAHVCASDTRASSQCSPTPPLVHTSRVPSFPRHTFGR